MTKPCYNKHVLFCFQNFAISVQFDWTNPLGHICHQWKLSNDNNINVKQNYRMSKKLPGCVKDLVKNNQTSFHDAYSDNGSEVRNEMYTIKEYCMAI